MDFIITFVEVELQNAKSVLVKPKVVYEIAYETGKQQSFGNRPVEVIYSGDYFGKIHFQKKEKGRYDSSVWRLFSDRDSDTRIDAVVPNFF